MSATIFACAAGCAALGAGALMPYEMADGAQDGSSRPTTAPVKAKPLPQLAVYEAMMGASLRKPLVDPAPPPVPPFAYRLVGIVAQPDRTMGLFVGPDGKGEWKSQGDMVGNGRITQMDDLSATLLIGDRPMTLQLPKQRATP